MLYKINLAILILTFSITFNLYADRTAIKSKDDPNPCQTDFDPNATMITFYGDSLGDLIDSPLYGYFGWEWYLTAHDPSLRWDIQNLAGSGSRTKNVALRQKITSELISRAVTTL
ncbi:MAG: hypothetical protein MH321_16075 [Leptospiraceae bacterium]|nr:hypothetical protein [Leptospiraceae bacterium]